MANFFSINFINSREKGMEFARTSPNCETRKKNIKKKIF